MNPDQKEPEESKLPCTNITINELDNPSVFIPTILESPHNIDHKSMYTYWLQLINALKTAIKTACFGFSKTFSFINRHSLSIYFFFNTFLLLGLVSKIVIYPKVVYYWIASSCILFLIKVIEFLQAYRANNLHSFELLERLEQQIRMSRTRHIIRQATTHNPFIENLFRNDQNFMNVINLNDHHFSRFSEYHTVFNNILRLRVHVLAMRMNMMMHSIEGFPEGENHNENPNGMNENEINDLEFQIYQKGDKEEPDCTICLETVIEGEEIRVLECGHTFHRLCIDKWLVLQRYCPYCRTIV